MEQSNITPSGAEEENIHIKEKPISEAASTEDSMNNVVTNTTRKNLLYEEYLGFIPNSLKGKQDPRYIYAKFFKQYKEFNYTDEDFLTYSFTDKISHTYIQSLTETLIFKRNLKNSNY